MKRRWFIRIFFMLPILLCLAGWWWSTGHGGWIIYSRDGHVARCGTVWGGMVAVAGTDLEGKDGWSTQAYTLHRSFHVGDHAVNAKVNFCGFEFGHPSWRSGLDVYELHVPYWFLIVVFTAVLFFVWRKTRAKLNPRTAFPVEASKPTTEQTSKAI